MKPGEIYLANFAANVVRPVIVVSRADLNLSGFSLVVVCVTEFVSIRKNLVNCLYFEKGEFGMPEKCVAQCQNMLSIDHDRLDSANGPIGVIDDAKIRRLIYTIGHILDARCEPE